MFTGIKHTITQTISSIGTISAGAFSLGHSGLERAFGEGAAETHVPVSSDGKELFRLRYVLDQVGLALPDAYGTMETYDNGEGKGELHRWLPVGEEHQVSIENSKGEQFRRTVLVEEAGTTTNIEIGDDYGKVLDQNGSYDSESGQDIPISVKLPQYNGEYVFSFSCALLSRDVLVTGYVRKISASLYQQNI